jgi:methionine sulfoxide reductase heme-binding subunit
MLARLRAWQLTAGQMRLLKVAAFLACTEPAVNMIYNFFWGDLGVNPVETLQHVSGEGSFTILIASLWVTPARRILKQNRLQGLRRMLGLWAFFYAFVHFLFYILLDQACLNWSECRLAGVVDDVMKRKFILAGMVSFLAMLPLALTSTKGWIRRLGKKWTTLHKLVYVAGLAAALHFIWKAKVADEEAFMYAAWVVAALLVRVYFAWQKRLVARPDPQGRVSVT